jgi:hypothetical protein
LNQQIGFAIFYTHQYLLLKKQEVFMKKIFTILIALTFFVYSGVCLAGSPKGLEKKGNATKGFTQGEKSGWDGEYPKGWDNLNGKEKEGMILFL